MNEKALIWGSNMSFLPKLLLVVLLAFPAHIAFTGRAVGAEDLMEDEEATEIEDDVVDDVAADDEDDEAEVEDDERTEISEGKEDDEEDEEASVGEVKASPNADTAILFVKGEDFPANDIVKFLLGFTNKGSEDFVVDSLDASFRYPQDYQFYIQNFTALQLGTAVPPGRQATFEYSFIPAEPMGGRPFGLVINLNYKDADGNVFQDAVFNQTVTVTEKEDGLDGETIFMYVFLSGLGLLVVVGLHQLLESRKRRRPAPKVEMGTSSHNDVDLSWIPQETLNQIRSLPHSLAHSLTFLCGLSRWPSRLQCRAAEVRPPSLHLPPQHTRPSRVAKRFLLNAADRVEKAPDGRSLRSSTILKR